jgi:arylsulfatase A-like enzyme
MLVNNRRKPAAAKSSVTRREFLKRSAAVAPLPAVLAQSSVERASAPAGKNRPNIVIIIADQFRWDVLGAASLSPMALTPNLDAMARRGVLFQSAVTNQPVCAPSRACLLTGQYQNRHGVWRNGVPLHPEAITMAKLFRTAGYTSNYIGKWHLAPNDSQQSMAGPVTADYRGGFLDLWEASNVLEHTSHAYEGDLYDADGKPIHFSDVYRVDFLTARAVRFLRNPGSKPFLLVVSYLEPHHQNDENIFAAPKGYAERYANPFIPVDLRPFPGDWLASLPGYYGCIASVDEACGAVHRALVETGLDENTIVVFTSDHGCHFRTRNTEYKRSPHESSVHIPLIVSGPGFNRQLAVPEVVSHVDLAPTLLEAASLPVPGTVQGKSYLPLLERHTSGWRNEVFIQISESMVGRALRTDRWKYAVVATTPNEPAGAPANNRYVEYQMYDLFADPHELVNLAGRREYRREAAELRERLRARVAEAGEAQPDIDQAPYYP